MLITLPAGQAQRVLYIPGRTVNRAAEGYRGDGKTDAKDAAIIADQVRIRRDLSHLRQVSTLVTGLRVFTAGTAGTSAMTARGCSTGCAGT